MDVQHAVVVIVSPVNGDVLRQRLTVVTAQQDGAVGQTLNFLLTRHCEKQQQHFDKRETGPMPVCFPDRYMKHQALSLMTVRQI